MESIPPEGWPAVIPRIFVDDAEALVEFIKATFNATGVYQSDQPSELRIGDSVIMVSGTHFRGKPVRDKITAFLYVYVEDVDATVRKALDRGASLIEELQAMPYGDRRGTVRDSWGNVWQIATRQELL